MKTVITEIRKIEVLEEHAQNVAIYGDDAESIKELAQKISDSGDIKPAKCLA